MKRVAVIGSEEKYWTPEQRTKVVKEIKDIFYNEYMKTLTYQFERKELDYDRIEYIIKRAFPEVAKNIILVSGGCPRGGVDIWAEIVADVLGIGKDIKRPDIQQWESTFADFGDEPEHSSFRHLKGYKERNIEIAETCVVLYCIDPKWRGSKTGGQWTMREAKRLNKETHLVEII